MYDTTDVMSITKDDVLNKISEYDIYSMYLSYKPVIGNLYISPLRNDKNPSFGLFYARQNKTLMFKDLGTGDCGDCFKFASLIENVSVRKIIKALYKDSVLNKIVSDKSQIIPIKKYEDKEIIVDSSPFTPEGLLFWNNFGISENTLKKFNVNQIKRFWVNSVEYWTATKNKPMFSYFIYSKTKIYRPFYKQMKFYSDCTTTDIQGWEQLDYDKEVVFITKSYKDVMLLDELGYTSIAPNGEGHSIPKKALDILRKNFKHIIILYDRDLPGLKAAHKLWLENRDFDFMFMPKNTQKDISDFYKSNSKNQTIKLLSNKLSNEK